MIAKDVREIPRMALSHVDDIEANLRGEVLTKASKMFGYAADTFNAVGPLAKVLVDLGIAPLDTVAVQLYMKSKEKKWCRRYDAWFRTLLVAGPVVALLGALFSESCLHASADTLGATVAIGVIVTAITLLVLNLFIFERNPFSTVEYTHSWAQYVLGRTRYDTGLQRRKFGYAEAVYVEPYTRYVPVHVLNIAVSVKTAVPEAVLYVHELQQTQMEIPKPLPDPFLEVRLDSERYYIAVWDEREFEAKL